MEEPTPACLALFQVEYAERDPETYVFSLAYAAGAPAEDLLRHRRQAVIARVHLTGPEGGTIGVLYDAMWEARFVRTLLTAAVCRRRPRSGTGILQGTRPVAVELAQSVTLPRRMP